MQMCRRNLKTFHYAIYKGKTDIIDAYGNVTGYSNVEYHEPIEMKARISATRGVADVDLFGISLNYSRTITTTDINCPIDENSILWIDEKDTTKPHDYVVVSVARDINYVVYAIRKVSAS